MNLITEILVLVVAGINSMLFVFKGVDSIATQAAKNVGLSEEQMKQMGLKPVNISGPLLFIWFLITFFSIAFVAHILIS